mmetsp:Transcript_1363/g.3391  ORF Transcript_1363/g.3391 Transcript_1363/m.3391 type:complete len:252 (+) Transcript_1363:1644-2399(+)
MCPPTRRSLSPSRTTVPCSRRSKMMTSMLRWRRWHGQPLGQAPLLPPPPLRRRLASTDWRCPRTSSRLCGSVRSAAARRCSPTRLASPRTSTAPAPASAGLRSLVAVLLASQSAARMASTRMCNSCSAAQLWEGAQRRSSGTAFSSAARRLAERRASGACARSPRWRASAGGSSSRLSPGRPATSSTARRPRSSRRPRRRQRRQRRPPRAPRRPRRRSRRRRRTSELGRRWMWRRSWSPTKGWTPPSFPRK